MKEKEEKDLRKEMLGTASEEMKYLSDESHDWELDDRELDMIAGGVYLVGQDPAGPRVDPPPPEEIAG